MLVEFSVENHRAFREKQTFSMVASAATERAGPDHVAQTGFSAVPHVLREACLFGANGSGKSSLIDAMAFMSRFVRNSFRNEPGKAIEVKPFQFHSEWRSKPSEFEAIFIKEDVLYQYGFALTCDRVIDEWLFARPRSTGRQRHLFNRSYDDATGGYEWDINNVYVKGERDSWKSQTRPDALFLSTAVQLRAEGLGDVFEWFKDQLKVIGEPSILRDHYTESRFDEEGWATRVSEFLQRADIALFGIETQDSKLLESEKFRAFPDHFQKMVVQEMMREKIPTDAAIQRSVYTVRLDERKKPVRLPLDEESSGTDSLFKLAGPILDVLDNGHVLVVDELNSCLHPLAFRHLVAMFSNPELNPKNAQLIFTTHDTSVTSCIGRDQIWLVEKRDDLAARLIPYSDFKTRDARPFQKGYLQGRYGAIPRIAS